MTRGLPATVERARQVPIEELIPQDVRRRIRAAGGSRGAASAQQAQGELDAEAADVFALCAAQLYETTPESGEPTYGLFTSTMMEVLKQARSPLTYRELAERITERYRALNRIAPTPMFEGNGANREVLGQKSWPDRPHWTLARGPNGVLTVNAGLLHGLTRGSVLEVVPPAGAADVETPLGYVAVVLLRPLESVVEPAAFNSIPAIAADRLIPGSRCRLAQADFGEMTLRLGLQRQGRARAESDDVEALPLESAPPVIAEALRRLHETTRGLARFADPPDEADWFLRLFPDGRAILVPASGLPRPGSGQSSVKPVSFEIARATDAGFAAQLVSNAVRLARARNLLAIAGAGVDGAGAISLRIELLRFPSPSATAGTLVPQAQRDLRIVRGSLAATSAGRAADPDLQLRIVRNGTDIPFDKHSAPPAVGEDLRLSWQPLEGRARYLLVLGGEGRVSLLSGGEIAAAGWRLKAAGAAAIPDAPVARGARRAHQQRARVARIPPDSHILWLERVPDLRFSGRTFPLSTR